MYSSTANVYGHLSQNRLNCTASFPIDILYLNIWHTKLNPTGYRNSFNNNNYTESSLRTPIRSNFNLFLLFLLWFLSFTLFEYHFIGACLMSTPFITLRTTLCTLNIIKYSRISVLYFNLSVWFFQSFLDFAW